MLRWLCGLLLLALGCAGAAHALTGEEARALAIGEPDARLAALEGIVAHADERTVALLQALAEDAVKASASSVFVIKDGMGHDPVTGAEVPVPGDAEDVVNNNLLRSGIDNALAAIRLFSSDAGQRAAAVKTLQDDLDEARLPLVE